MAVVARSKSINGPWDNSPLNPLIHTYSGTERWWSKGHASLIDTPDGRWWIVYHAYEKDFLNLGRQTLLEPVQITEDGWLEAPLGRKAEEKIACPIPLASEWKNCDRLKEFRIGLDWKFYKQYEPGRFSIKDSMLMLKAQGSNPAESSPIMFVTGAHGYEMSVKIECDSSAVAGLILYYNDNFYVGTGCDTQYRYRWRRGELKGKNKYREFGAIWLRLRNENNIVTGYYSYDGKEWIKEAWGMEISGYNHNTLSDFQSILPGLFVYGKGKACFKEFQYRCLDSFR